jgi:hypothetical protein
MDCIIQTIEQAHKIPVVPATSVVCTNAMVPGLYSKKV